EVLKFHKKTTNKVAMRQLLSTAICFLTLAFFLGSAYYSIAQQSESTSSSVSHVRSPVKVSGGITLSGDFYTAEGIEARRPTSNLMAIARINVSLFDHIHLPFEAFLGSNHSEFRQPFNQLGISPTFFGWLTLHAGWFSLQISDLTFGDIRVLGAGLEVRSDRIRLAALYGSTNQIVPYDIRAGGIAVAGAFTAYQRPVFGLKLGYGDENTAFINIQALRVIDDTTSLLTPSTADPTRLAQAQENTVISTTFGVAGFDGNVRCSAELAVSAFSQDIRSRRLAEVAAPSGLPFLDIPPFLFTPRLSSQLDAAAKVTLTIAPVSDISCVFAGQYIGPGFVSLGYAQLQNDVLEGTVSPSLRLFSGALSLRGTAGVRVNNLVANRIAPIHRFIASGSLSFQPIHAFGIDVQYSNYGLRSTPRNDTLRIENVAQSLSIAPRCTFEVLGGSSTLLASYARNDVEDLNVITRRINTNQTHTGIVSWSLSLPSGVSLSTTGFYSDITQQLLRIETANIGQSVSYGFFDGTLATSLTLGYGFVTATEQSSPTTAQPSHDGQLTGQLTASYTIGEAGKLGTLSLNVHNNNYAFGNPARGRSFGEWTAIIQYSIGF
ncbi:MAG: hypothetical protein RML40_07185, partial [Bacteroidota bacterium]|nr:hypothetical protein [Candidatus Kapabacteria bacterium]MDW8220300.1 hypothetical protein [Bacteroidota bacterium]